MKPEMVCFIPVKTPKQKSDFLKMYKNYPSQIYVEFLIKKVIVDLDV